MSFISLFFYKLCFKSFLCPLTRVELIVTRPMFSVLIGKFVNCVIDVTRFIGFAQKPVCFFKLGLQIDWLYNCWTLIQVSMAWSLWCRIRRSDHAKQQSNARTLRQHQCHKRCNFEHVLESKLILGAFKFWNWCSNP